MIPASGLSPDLEISRIMRDHIFLFVFESFVIFILAVTAMVFGFRFKKHRIVNIIFLILLLLPGIATSVAVCIGWPAAENHPSPMQLVDARTALIASLSWLVIISAGWSIGRRTPMLKVRPILTILFIIAIIHGATYSILLIYAQSKEQRKIPRLIE